MKRILEIGGGITPYFMRYDIPWIDSHEYICLDVSEKNIDQSKAAIERLTRSGAPFPSRVQMLVHDAVTLPFEDRSIDEIVLSNILSAPIHFNWNHDGTKVIVDNSSGTIERKLLPSNDADRFYRERKPIILESLRVLKPGGRLTIYTDLLIYGIHSYERIIQDLIEHPEVSVRVDEVEQLRVDELNVRKLHSGDFCYCLDAEVLPRSEVYRCIKN